MEDGLNLITLDSLNIDIGAVITTIDSYGICVLRNYVTPSSIMRLLAEHEVSFNSHKSEGIYSIHQHPTNEKGMVARGKTNNLLHVLSNIASTLKPGGVLISQEPYTDSNINNQVFNEIYDAKEVFAGKVIRHGDRDDHFYRKCEYLTAVHHSGLNIVKQCDIGRMINKKNLFVWSYSAVRKSLLLARRAFQAQETKSTSFAEMRSQKLKPKHLLLLCQRPVSLESTPHRWCKEKSQ